ncbi:hypothetical protein GOODEAATRI_000876 [Goodea atripinnis]|uniref:Desmoplakin spectrin-like domain-containing protein n=1 Tax=Goodea atripinnis TaxID=208336 RepID=A0ABV0MXN1_9TELE
MEPGNLMHLKHMQIRKPLMKSSLADPSMTEEEVNLKYVQDLLNWVEEMQDEKEQLLQYRSTVAGLVGRAKNIVQLRPRNPESPLRSSIPVKAICDYRQIEIKTMLPGEHQQVLSNLQSHFEEFLEDSKESEVFTVADCTQLDRDQWRSEIDERQEVFHDMEDELQKARVISDRMFKAHNERDFDLDWHKEKADQLSERWHNIHSQIDSRRAFERAEDAKRTESMEVQKARGEVEIRQLKQRIQEQEVLLTEREAQVEKLELELETQKKTIKDLNVEKAKLEHDVSQYHTKLDIMIKDKAATEQELNHTKLLMEQSEATWSLTQKKPEDLLKKENDAQRPSLHKNINAGEVDVATAQEFHVEVLAKSNAQTVQPLGFESQSELGTQLEGSAVRIHDVLQQKLDELSQVQKKAEIAEETAQSYKKLLDDSNNRLKKLQMDMESERVQTREKSEDFHQEMLNMKKSISEFQEEIRSLQRAKSSLEQNSFFQNTEVEGLKEQLKITQIELQKKSSIEQENSYKVNNLEEEVASKQAAIDQLKIKCNELMKMNVSCDSDIRGLQIQTVSLEKERSFSEQKIKSLKSEIESWKQQLQSSKDENIVVKRIEQALQIKCKNLESELQKSEIVTCQLQRKVDELKQINLEVEQNLKNAKAKLDQVMMEIESKDQQIKIFKSQAESAKSQVRIIEEELSKKSQTIYELQIKLQEYNLPSSIKVHGYMALCGLTDPRQNETNTSKTRTYQIREIHETVNTPGKSSGNSSGTLGVATSQKHQEIIGRSDIQQWIKHKLLDEGVLRKLEMGLLTIEQVQASLTQQSDKPATVAGVYVESSKKKTSFLEAAEKGFLAKTYALEFLEAQAATGSLVDLATGATVSVAQALERGIVDLSMKEKLTEAEKAVSGYNFKGRKLSVFQAMEERILDRYKGKRILDVQVTAGGLINPETGKRVPTFLALNEGLLNKETLQSLYDPVSNPKGFHSPDTGQKAYYSEILKTCLYDINGSVFLVPFGERHLTNTSPMNPHRMSVVNSSCGLEMSVYEAFKGKHINKKTYLFLSQQESNWQEDSLIDPSGNPCHFITDARSGRQLCLESALSHRFLEMSEFESYRNGLLSIYEIADIIFSRWVVVEDVNSTIAGLWDITRKKRLSVLQGLQQGFTDRVTALRLLESQACTGGICDPSSGEKHTLADALKIGLLDESLKQQLQRFEEAFSGITHPQTRKVLSVLQAVQENLFPKDVGFRCIEFQLLTGGMINPDTKDRVCLEEVIQSSFVDKVTATLLKDEKMTEEDRMKTQEQLNALSQAYSEISQQCSDQITSADEVGF